MQREKIKELVHGHLHRLGKNAEAINKDFDEEAIHGFRVEVKKMRALLRLLAVHYDHVPTGFSRHFRDIYHTTGHLRDAQLMSGRWHEKREPDFPELMDWLDGQIGDYKDEWEKHKSAPIIHALSGKLHDMEYGHLDTDDVVYFFSKRLRFIKEQLGNRELDDEELHDIRKKLKDMQYVERLLAAEWPEGHKAIEKFPLDKLQMLADTAGKYNDMRISLEILENFEEDSAPVEDRQTLDMLKLNWLEQKAVQRQQLMDDLAVLR
jgi:CHAD domain-containing protein